jgi:hypothetical protein
MPADAIKQCERWRTALNDGGYDYVVISPDQRTQESSPVEATWTGRGTSGIQVVEADMVFVFDLNADLNPAECADIVAAETGNLQGIAPPQIERISPPQPQQ